MDTNLQPKNEYFSKKEAKERMRSQGQNNRILKSYLSWAISIIAVVLIGWWLFGYFKNASQEKAVIEAQTQYFQAQSRDHISVGEDHPEYNSNPPTGGWHFDAASQTGIYDQELPDERLVHNLEHSHIWIAYRPDLAPEEIEKLAQIAMSYGSSIIMTPRSASDTPIALVAWERLLKMDTVDEAKTRAFIDTYRGIAGPEKIPDSGFKDFRKK